MVQFEIPANNSMKKVEIKGRFYGDKTFPSLNNLLAEYAKNPKAGGRMKRKFQDICCWNIRAQIGNYKATKPLILHYRFFEPSKGQKRDFMNILDFFDKIFDDALQDCKVIENDSPKYLLNITHDFFYTDKEPWIEVYLEEINNG